MTQSIEDKLAEMATHKKRTDLVMEVMPNAEEMARNKTKAFNELPLLDTFDGIREVSMLTAWARSQDAALEPVMTALLRLRDLKWDPERKFMIVNNARHLDWTTMPRREYPSFDEFYRLELEPSWGKWSDLEREWGEVTRGTKTVDEVQRRFLRGHGGDRRSEEAEAYQASNRSLKSHGTTSAYIEAKLRDKGFDELADKVEAKTMSARAAGIEAGIITPDMPLTLLRRAWKRADEEERETFRAEIQTERQNE